MEWLQVWSPQDAVPAARARPAGRPVLAGSQGTHTMRELLVFARYRNRPDVAETSPMVAFKSSRDCAMLPAVFFSASIWPRPRYRFLS